MQRNILLKSYIFLQETIAVFFVVWNKKKFGCYAHILITPSEQIDYYRNYSILIPVISLAI